MMAAEKAGHIAQQHKILADGVELNVFDWPGALPSSPVMLLVHGYRANAHWWDDLVDKFAGRYRVIVPEFSGMGGSDWRPSYNSDSHGIEDLSAVFSALNIVADVVVAHSWGGYQMAGYCCANPSRVKQLIFVDSFFMVGPDENAPSAPAIGNTKTYASKEEALVRFRTSPRQPIPEHRRIALATASLRAVENGWSWAYDPKLPTLQPSADDEQLLASLQTPCAYILAGNSGVISVERAEVIVSLSRCTEFIVIDGLHHHLMLEQPEKLVDSIRYLIQQGLSA